MNGTWMDALLVGPYRFSLFCLIFATLLAVVRRKASPSERSPKSVFQSYLGALDPQCSSRECVTWAPNAAGCTTSDKTTDFAEEEILDAQISEV